MVEKEEFLKRQYKSTGRIMDELILLCTGYHDNLGAGDSFTWVTSFRVSLLASLFSPQRNFRLRKTAEIHNKGRVD